AGAGAARRRPSGGGSRLGAPSAASYRKLCRLVYILDDMAITWVRSGPLRLRPLRADDGQRLGDLFARLSPRRLYRRVLPPARALARLGEVDHWQGEAIAALEGDDIVAVARYSRAPGADVAEIALVVADEWQRRGVGRLLMRRLGRLARRRGIRSFVGTIAGE